MVSKISFTRRWLIGVAGMLSFVLLGLVFYTSYARAADEQKIYLPFLSKAPLADIQSNGLGGDRALNTYAVGTITNLTSNQALDITLLATYPAVDGQESYTKTVDLVVSALLPGQSVPYRVDAPVTVPSNKPNVPTVSLLTITPIANSSYVALPSPVMDWKNCFGNQGTIGQMTVRNDQATSIRLTDVLIWRNSAGLNYLQADPEQNILAPNEQATFSLLVDDFCPADSTTTPENVKFVIIGERAS